MEVAEDDGADRKQRDGLFVLVPADAEDGAELASVTFPLDVVSP